MTPVHQFFCKIYSATLTRLSVLLSDSLTRPKNNYYLNRQFFTKITKTLVPTKLISFIQKIRSSTVLTISLKRNHYIKYFTRESTVIGQRPKQQIPSETSPHTFITFSEPYVTICNDPKVSLSYNIHGYNLEPEIPAEEFHISSNNIKISGTFIPVRKTRVPLTEPDWDPSFILIDQQITDVTHNSQLHFNDSTHYLHSLDETKTNVPLIKYAQAIQIMAERRNWLSPKSSSALNKLIDGDQALTESELNSINYLLDRMLKIAPHSYDLQRIRTLISELPKYN